MESVLVISYYFPPMGGAGVQRALKFVKYLPEFGWQPHVLTAHPPKAGLRDERLLKEIPPGTPITRTAALLPPQRLPWRLRDFINRWLLVVDEQIGWYPFACRTGMRIIHKSQVDLIYSTSPPNTAHLIACHLHKQTNIPWVADFRDPWIGNFSLRFATPLHRKLAIRLERQVIQNASHVLVISPPMSQSFCERITGTNPAKFTWLPNGFDAQDFLPVQPIKRENDRFHLVYTGSFYARGLTAHPILQAIQTAVLTDQIPRQNLRVQLVGNIGKSTYKWISEMNLEDIVETPGYVPHEQSIAYLRAADALLLIIGVSPGSSVVYTGKIFEYLAAVKPILCLAKDGAASDLIQAARAGIVVPPDDIPQITQRLVEMYQHWQIGHLSIDPDQELIKSFERRRLTSQLASIFNDLTGKAA